MGVVFPLGFDSLLLSAYGFFHVQLVRRSELIMNEGHEGQRGSKQASSATMMIRTTRLDLLKRASVGFA